MYRYSTKFCIILSTLQLILVLAGRLEAEEKIAVVRSTYDPVDRVLSSMNIKYDLIEFHDLEEGSVFKKYDVMFFPCGMNYPLEMNVSVLSRGVNIQSVALKNKIYEPDKEKIAAKVRAFLKAGGYAYFSGYSFDLLQQAFGIFHFHDNFPYMGLPGRIESVLKGDLANFTMKESMALYMGHSGWITLDSVDNADVLARAAYATPRGEKEGPITCTGSVGRGFFLYTVYHDTVYSDFRRFNIYRVLGARLIDRLDREAAFWDQKISGNIADAMHGNENSRTYLFKMMKGTNSVYFTSSARPFQVEILDRSFSIIESHDCFDRSQEFTVYSDKDDYGYIRIYPASNDRYSLYSVVTAHGIRLIPYFFTALIVLGGIALLSGIVFLVVFFSRRGYSGLGRKLGL
ncbi:MAG TPA: hypothetical protein PK926_03255 [Spirochaetota bacterium]|nr:hypothetical protein [Spirochaetota bacterium]